MNNNDTGTPRSNLLRMTLARVEATKADHITGISMVLRGADSTHAMQEFRVAIPPELTKEYELAIQQIFMKAKVEPGILHDFQRSTGVHIRKVVVDTEQDGDDSEALVYTLSEMGEAVTFHAPTHSTVLYALLNDLPIMVDEALTTEAAESASTSEESTEEHSPESPYLESITAGLKPEEVLVTKEEISKLWELPKESLMKLMDEAVKTENYEWAHLIQKHSEEEEDEQEES